MFGEKCTKCEYNKCIAALEFHHKRGNKEFEISKRRSFEKLIEEAKKCILICANCHREEHYLG